MLVETEGNHVFADRASLEDLLATRLDFYQAQGVAACVRRVRDARLFAPDLAQLRVHDTLRQADGDAVVAWERVLMLRRMESGWRTCAVATIGEAKAWAERGTPFTG
jgi:hypothetical protein